MTARARLMAVCVTLVAVAGVALIALTYVLVRGHIAVRVNYGARVGAEREPREGDLPDLADQVRQETLRDLLGWSLVALAVVVVVAGVAGWLVAGRLLRPIRAISRTAQRVWVGNLRERVPADGPQDELTALAGTVNGMLDRVQEGMAERDRLLDQHRLFVANAAHELRTPLTTIRTAIDVTLDGKPTPPELRGMVTDVSAAVDASLRTLDGLLTLARSQAGSLRREHVDLARAAAAAVDQGGAEAARLRVRLTAHLRPAPVHGDEVLLLRLAGNLVDNALRYNHPGGVVRVEAWTDGPTASLRVTNSGPTVEPHDLATLFQPFTRGAGDRLRSGGGTGLGLSIVDAVVTAHSGTVAASAPTTGGLDVTVRLPARTVDL